MKQKKKTHTMVQETFTMSLGPVVPIVQCLPPAVVLAPWLTPPLPSLLSWHPHCPLSLSLSLLSSWFLSSSAATVATMVLVFVCCCHCVVVVVVVVVPGWHCSPHGPGLSSWVFSVVSLLCHCASPHGLCFPLACSPLVLVASCGYGGRLERWGS
jgi:hypothetical protein